ncbi:MAG: radical SAM protein [Patescibacteria group bacterium]|nr:radical SAM protein [Patescibacteria group bacterium]
MVTSSQINQTLENIYISPLESCNLNCSLCYTRKTRNILGNKQILDFVDRYQKQVNLKSVLFCGGEVFGKRNFHQLINELTRMKIFITIITNGTIDQLKEINDPRNCQLLVSLDGPKEIHDANRGKGNFQKSISFIKKALSLGFPTEIMFLVTPASYLYKDSFSDYLCSCLFPSKPSNPPNFNYITVKTSFFNPKLNFPGLAPDQILDIKKNYSSIPDKNFGCFQLSLQSDGQIYGCCESSIPIAKITDPIDKILENFKKSLTPCQKCGECGGCCQPEFLCGYIKELGVKNCQEVVKLINKVKSQSSKVKTKS